MKLKAVYEGKLWDVKTLFLQERGSTAARLERGGEVAFPSHGQITILRSTGLFDRNGVEIFEHDIVRFSYAGRDVFELVRWDEHHTGFLPFSQPYGINDAWISSRLVQVTEDIFEPSH